MNTIVYIYIYKHDCVHIYKHYSVHDLQADVYGQQVDLRPSNTWVKKLSEVPVTELLQTHAVNAMAPFIFVQQLKPLLEKASSTAGEAYVVNVSAREGKFNKSYNSMCHPHTNMAKASLNMLTRTSAEDYAASGIFMNAVDTGWVTDETPLVQHQHHNGRGDEPFEPPLDEVTPSLPAWRTDLRPATHAGILTIASLAA